MSRMACPPAVIAMWRSTRRGLGRPDRWTVAAGVPYGSSSGKIEGQNRHLAEHRVEPVGPGLPLDQIVGVEPERESGDGDGADDGLRLPEDTQVEVLEVDESRGVETIGVVATESP